MFLHSWSHPFPVADVSVDAVYQTSGMHHIGQFLGDQPGSSADGTAKVIDACIPGNAHFDGDAHGGFPTCCTSPREVANVLRNFDRPLRPGGYMFLLDGPFRTPSKKADKWWAGYMCCPGTEEGSYLRLDDYPPEFRDAILERGGNRSSTHGARDAADRRALDKWWATVKDEYRAHKRWADLDCWVIHTVVWMTSEARGARYNSFRTGYYDGMYNRKVADSTLGARMAVLVQKKK